MAFDYGVYGITVSSDIPLPLPAGDDPAAETVRLTLADDDYFEQEAGAARHDPEWTSWFQYAPIADGRSYVRGWEMGEVIVSADGRHIVCRPDFEASADSFHVYLLGQALSFALLKLGFEPLHATAVVIDGRAVALLGNSGNGKSTLAASFLASGGRLLTDDVLMVRESTRGTIAYPGPGRLKLFPNVAVGLVEDLRGVVTMNNQTTKLVVALDGFQVHAGPAPLAAIYDIKPPTGTPGTLGVRIEPMSGRDAALALVKAAFNQRLVNRDRLSRQFEAATSLANRVPVRRLIYPRVLAGLPDVVRAVHTDLAGAEVMSHEAVR